MQVNTKAAFARFASMSPTYGHYGGDYSKQCSGSVTLEAKPDGKFVGAGRDAVCEDDLPSGTPYGVSMAVGQGVVTVTFSIGYDTGVLTCKLDDAQADASTRCASQCVPAKKRRSCSSALSSFRASNATTIASSHFFVVHTLHCKVMSSGARSQTRAASLASAGLLATAEADVIRVAIAADAARSAASLPACRRRARAGAPGRGRRRA
jgi:hypothetical protein